MHPSPNRTVIFAFSCPSPPCQCTLLKEDYDREAEEVHESRGDAYEGFSVIKQMVVGDGVTLTDK